MVELFPTTIDVLDDNNHSINIIHQVKEGYDLVNQLKLERYSTNGDKEFEKVLLDSITTAEECSYGMNFSILRWKDNYISEASKTANNLSYIEKMKFNLDGDTIEQTSLSSNNYNFPFSILPYAYNKSFTKAGDDVYIVGASYFNFANSTNGYLVFKGNNDLNVLWSENIAKPSQNIYDVILNTELDDTSILCISLVNDTSVADTMFQVQFVKISLTGNQLYYSSYVDRNFNGTKDADDTLFADGLIEVSNGNTSVDYTPNYDGTFSKIVGKGTFVSKLIDYNQRLKYYTVNPINKTTIFNGTKQVDSIFFRLTPKPNIQDLQVSIVPFTIARPGFNSSYKIIAKNVGTKMMYLPTVKFIKDSLQTFTDSTTYALDADTLFWQIDSLSLLEQREIVVSVLNATPPTLNANDTLHLSAQIFPMENDSFSQDNYASLNQVVRNSVDPNDKIETHGGTIPYSAVQNRDYLYYTIRFQNTGNSYATRIVITDTLTENVDASTFEFLSSSVPFVMNVVDRKHFTWTAANTYLPDSIADEPNSHGYISFRIKPKAGLLPSDEITNRASIVFDYNAAILTNTCTTNIIEQRILSVKNNEIKSIHLFPNPTNGNVQLNMNLLQNKNYTLRIIDINGNLLSNENLKGNAGENNVSIDLSSYANGLYFIQVSDETGNLFYGKVVKQ
ncbi:MAG: T9SS type A sorting domain-containing protein [Saprospirales bacterium]|nr:T9SS type A sorting domain-containing protein [Saprospirales bacterium]